MIGKIFNLPIAQNITTVIHDIASPVTLIRLNLDMLETKIQETHTSKSQILTIKKYLKRAITGVEKVSKIIDFTMDNQYSIQSQESFNVKRALLNIINSFEIRTTTEKVGFKFNIDNKARIQGSIIAFNKVLGNLISNAFDAYSYCKDTADKKVSISAHKNGNYLIITFEDMAGGISDAILKNIFKKQFTTKSNGNGIGLISINNIIVNQFKGFINCFSKKGKGTIFAIAFPLSKTLSK
jgi:signal transduction histidine kinase